MSLDRAQIGIIKEHFARKSSAQLQEILRANDRARWSEETFVAAQELLVDREAGRAHEPGVPESELPPPSGRPIEYQVAKAGLIVLTGLWGRFLIPIDGTYDEDAVAKDMPVPFGSKIAWLALDTTDTEAVASALGLQEARTATWKEGIDAAYRSAVFVTPPVGQWTLAVSSALLPPELAEPYVKPLLEQLSRQFRHAQYFCSHRVVELHLWARARAGHLTRGFGWLGETKRVIWDEGHFTPEERELGFQFSGGAAAASEDQAAKAPNVPDENCVMQLAYLWSIDPTALNEQYKEPVMGVLGNFAKA